MGDRLEGTEAWGHLGRRAGFGRAPEPVPAAPPVYEKEVSRLLDDLGRPAPEDPAGFDPYRPVAIQQVWLDRMVSGVEPLAERLAFFWHGHFATSDAKVQDPALLWAQYRLFRAKGAGRFRDLLDAVARDPAMVRWLDGNSNRKGHPNENFARELQELFTLGIGAYTERDVREVARAFSGWGSRHHEFAFRDEHHDHGEKSIHGVTGDLDGGDAIRVLSEHPAAHRFLARKLLRAFSHPEPTDAEVDAVAAEWRRTDGDVKEVLRFVFLSESFRSRSRQRALVRGPVDACVAALRAVGATSFPHWLHASLERMGQVLFRPPSVKGWTSGAGWLTSAGLVERLRAARRIADEADAAAFPGFETAAFDGAFPSRLSETLRSAGERDRVALALASPEFQLA